jgi:hypothetical protein
MKIDKKVSLVISLENHDCQTLFNILEFVRMQGHNLDKYYTTEQRDAIRVMVSSLSEGL